MELTETIYCVIDALESGLKEASAGRKVDSFKIAYNSGYIDALKNIRFIITTILNGGN